MSSSRFRQSDVTRAIKGALDGGMTVARCEITADGSIVITTESAASAQSDPFEAWKASKSARRAERPA